MPRTIEEAALAFDRAMDACGTPYVIVRGLAAATPGVVGDLRDLQQGIDEGPGRSTPFRFPFDPASEPAPARLGRRQGATLGPAPDTRS